MVSFFGLGGIVGVESDQTTFSNDNPALWQYDSLGNVVNRPRSNMLGGYVNVSARICDLI